MATLRKEFSRRLYELVSDTRVCTQCDSRKVIKNPQERCECGKAAWRKLTLTDFEGDIEVIFARADGLRLSTYLADCAGKTEEWSDARTKIIESLQGFSDGPTAQWITDNVQNDEESVATLFDDVYTRDFLKNAEVIVDRTMKISAMAPKATPDHGVNLFLREASRCFIHGFWSSSVALSRAALELGLKQQLKRRLGGDILTDDCLLLLLKRAHNWSLIDDAGLKMGDDVRKNGNKILHRSHVADEDLAWDTLWAVRGVLKSIHAS